MQTVAHFVASRGLGRGESYVELVNEMSLKLETYLICPPKPLFKSNLSSGVKLLEYQSWNSRHNPFLRFELDRIFKSISPDIVHSHFAKGAFLVSRCSQKHFRAHVSTKRNCYKGKIYNNLKIIVIKRNSKHRRAPPRTPPLPASSFQLPAPSFQEFLRNS